MTFDARALRRRLAPLALLLIGVLAFLPATAQGASGQGPGDGPGAGKRELTVMTQNIYLGSSLTPAIEATTLAELLAATAQIYQTVLDTDFPSRSEAIADSIAEHRPDLIGLQEVTRWTTTGEAPPGFDFLAILLGDFAERGLDYSVVAVADNASIGPIPLTICDGPFLSCAVTLEDRDVILVNDATPKLELTSVETGRYAAQAALETPFGPISFDRGWALVDGRLEGKKFRFANTHLETGASPDIQQAQGQEFLAGPAKAGGAVIAVGDFNSAADGSSTTTYADLTKAWFDDAWDSTGGRSGPTCCQASALDNATSLLVSRIDLVLTHAASRALDAEVVNDTTFQGIPPLWPSDHAGVVATVRIH